MKRALVLAAGGVTGALYEVGVLRALEEELGAPEDLFDLFLGVSAGASVAAFVAQGVRPSRLFEALLSGDDPLLPVRQRDVVPFDLRHAARLAAAGSRLLFRAAAGLLRRRGPAVAELAALLPAGLFSLDPYRRFLAAALTGAGLADDFRVLRRRLLIPATDLDSGDRVLFGAPPWDDVLISTAIAASSAIPAFFEPLPIRGRHLIDGNVGKVAHLDALIAEGASRVLVVSPVVPVRNGPAPCIVPGESGVCGSLRDRGMWAVHNQAWRVEQHVRLHLGIGRFQAENTGLEIVLLEPPRSDGTLFLANPMSFAARREVLEAGYAQGRAFLAEHARRMGSFN
jgi:predicted acylesterase/phospholipase RssA